MDKLTGRKNEILEMARSLGRVNVDDLAEHFKVTTQTIRKDINDICARRLLTRIHGGAVVSSGIQNLTYDARRSINREEKSAIGRAAAQLIPNGASLFINIGTTTEEVAGFLTDHEGLLVITNNLNVAMALYPHPMIDVIVAGGPVRRADGAIVGQSPGDFIQQFKVDYAIIGASAIDEEGSLLDFDIREVRVSRAIIDNARQIILVADQMKFQRTAPVRIGHLKDVDIFVTDRLPSAKVSEVCALNNVEVVEVGGPESEAPGTGE